MNREDDDLKVDDFNYVLPEHLIASRPGEKREDSRMLVVDRENGTIEHRRFSEFPTFVDAAAGDLLVFNNTRVMPARFLLDGGRRELVRLTFEDPMVWECMVRPGKKFRVGHTAQIGDAIGTVESIRDDGTRVLRFSQAVDVDHYGKLALPPYVDREEDAQDRERYQTVYATEPGAVAAPTAGLHFTNAMVEALPHVFVTLHVGPGTFRPVKTDRVSDHRMHSEQYNLSESSAKAITDSRRCIAVGTTVARVLESCATDGMLRTGTGMTDIFLYPPYTFKVVDCLLTNFHLPKSTLLMLVSALAGTDLIREAYAEAIASKYRFFSYGDCMLIL